VAERSVAATASRARERLLWLRDFVVEADFVGRRAFQAAAGIARVCCGSLSAPVSAFAIDSALM
jgi:hypothetical protein